MPGQEANGDNSWMSFRSSIDNAMSNVLIRIASLKFCCTKN